MIGQENKIVSHTRVHTCDVCGREETVTKFAPDIIWPKPKQVLSVSITVSDKNKKGDVCPDECLQMLARSAVTGEPITVNALSPTDTADTDLEPRTALEVVREFDL